MMMTLPTPYWQSDDGRATLYCGDCLELLPLMVSGSVDAVVTDPPYGLGDRLDGAGGSSQWDLLFGDGAPEWDRETTPAALQMALGMASYQIVWGGNYYDLPPARCWFIWDKMQEHTSGHGELAWTNLDKPIRTFRYARAQLASEGKEHPTQKPLRLMKWCINHLPDECDTILDPFAGSGTTGVACIQTGRKFIGIELNEKYCAIAARRLAAACCEDGGLFDPKAKHRATLFSEAV